MGSQTLSRYSSACTHTANLQELPNTSSFLAATQMYFDADTTLADLPNTSSFLAATQTYFDADTPSQTHRHWDSQQQPGQHCMYMCVCACVCMREWVARLYHDTHPHVHIQQTGKSCQIHRHSWRRRKCTSMQTRHLRLTVTGTRSSSPASRAVMLRYLTARDGRDIMECNT